MPFKARGSGNYASPCSYDFEVAVEPQSIGSSVYTPKQNWGIFIFYDNNNYYWGCGLI